MALEGQKERAIATHSAQAEKFAVAYREGDRDAYSTCFGYSRRRLQALLDRDLGAPSAGARVLDVGCGTGHHLSLLRSRGFDVAGIDGSDEMLKQARLSNPGADLRVADVEAIPFSDNVFDFVLSVEVLRYLPDPHPSLGEMWRVLRPGGVCLATAAPIFNLNAYWLVNRLAPLVPGVRLTRLKQFFASSGRLRADFRRAGFRDVQVHGVYLGPINWVERLAPKALPFFLRGWERMDRALADRMLFREFSNMFLVRGVKG